MNDHMEDPKNDIEQNLPESAAMELRNGLTGIPQGIHCAATQTSGGSSTDELDDIAIEHFLNTLSEVAIAIAARESEQRTGS